MAHTGSAVEGSLQNFQEHTKSEGVTMFRTFFCRGRYSVASSRGVSPHRETSVEAGKGTVVVALPQCSASCSPSVRRSKKARKLSDLEFCSDSVAHNLSRICSHYLHIFALRVEVQLVIGSVLCCDPSFSVCWFAAGHSL